MAYTYADTQIEPTADNLWMVPKSYNLWLTPAPDITCGYVETPPNAASPAFEVCEIPASVPPVHVARHLAVIAIAVHPDKLRWPAVAELPAGSLVKSYRDGNVVRVPSDNWTGGHCIGWINQ